MPNLTYAQLEALKAARDELAELKRTELLRPFVADMLESLGIALAVMPLQDWPPVAKAALTHAAHRAPEAAKLYRSRLPKAGLGKLKLAVKV